MKALATHFAKEQSGAVAIEFGLIIVIICLGIVVLASQAASQMNAVFKTLITAERRRRRHPSDQILARSCAVIGLLIKSGLSEEQALQVVSSQILAAGIAPPNTRGWKWLQLWRANLLDGVATEAACAEFHIFARQLEGTPAGIAVDQELWDRRRAA